ncbi:receptor kinase-like protein Xa21 [Triticum aestivum]|uniref:receptor kinase-like protein Xa21 n=1 Tax=Triticum aestivum TaxID=4565 RepID=UPI001D021805|nr:receptor kinase-like protein Xa21 [Triticum aestivum]
MTQQSCPSSSNSDASDGCEKMKSGKLDDRLKVFAAIPRKKTNKRIEIIKAIFLDLPDVCLAIPEIQQHTCANDTLTVIQPPLYVVGRQLQQKAHPGRVTVLDLQDMSLAGQITPSLGNLTSLRKLTLDSNRLSGQLPPLNRLTRLEELSLGTNLLQGDIPDALTNCSKLKSLNLALNMLVGSIPENIGFLTNLVVMDLSGNNLSGIIPQTFSNISRLREMSLADNLLVGSIPKELGQLTDISIVFLGGNSLSSSVPATLFNLSYLQILDLDTNMLSGTLPSDVGHMLPNLQFLFLGENKLDGHIPDSLGNASELGQRPGVRLHFQKKGLLLTSIGNLSIKLQQLNLGQNNLFRTVPPTIGKYRNLFKLTLSYNNLTGTIEKWVGTLKNLQGLYLEGNTFVGSIPNSLGNLNKLTSLYLSKNQFDGLMPANLGNLSQLTQLDLSYNNIQGNIPLQISRLKQLMELHLSSNKRTGEIPSNLDQCDNLITIQIDQNMLIGEIPTSFGNLIALNVLNLSQNNLSGTVPATLSDLQLLSKLDLSHNHLHGEIPRNGVYINATCIYLEGNWGLCGGVADLQMPLCSAISQRSETEYYLVRILVPILGFTSLIMLAYIIILGKNTSRRTYVSFLSFGKKFPRVSYSDLNRATGNFSKANIIGKGSYGTVYRGKLTQAKIQVAINVFNLDMKCADKSFVTECEVLRSIRHRILVPILTACSTIDNNGDAFKALVYEFMPNGNLDTWLHNRFLGSSAKQLSLAQRASVAVGIADALAYLHHHYQNLIRCRRPMTVGIGPKAVSKGLRRRPPSA